MIMHGNKGRKFTEEHKQKIAAAHKGKKKWENRVHPRGMLGKRHSLESRQKISQNHSRHNLGKKLSEGHKEKLSESHKGQIAWSKGKERPEIQGSNHPMWGGGETISSGYRLKLINGKYKQEHRLVMEHRIGRKLKKNEVVHHWDLDKLNNDPENLALLRSESAHQRIHRFAERNNLTVGQLKFAQSWLFAK